ncbi:lipoprotein [Hymenobacter qilianensis]|uniref:Lipoprotein n=2 Tax=Hymenobacter qilianensis TaxID=1385715 RepID=A0ACB5PN28_9BACT|nr:DUF4136 domain-containing protein [Hymenobacter qilianensis]QNP53609.1 DUF4136 domain-containing protein [Hymenobacter qilianensis]GGF54621.1 lipoprotein [Hymenobacter qilianensis]
MNAFTSLFRRPVALAAVGLSLLLGATSCTSSRVGVTSDYDHSINFRTYKTWSWYPQQTSDAEGGPARGYQSFLDKRMRTAVETEMKKKGLTYTEQSPDLYVAYNAKVEDKQQINGGGFGYPFYGYGGYGMYGRGPYGNVTQYKAGTVIIDLVDAKRKELAWRGQGQAQIDKNTISEEEVYRIVGGILENYPPQDGTNVNARR